MMPFLLEDIRRVTFYKRDELTTDLICCDVEVDGGGEPMTWFCHEEAPDWQNWLDNLGTLAGFDREWFAKVTSQLLNHVQRSLMCGRTLLEPTALED